MLTSARVKALARECGFDLCGVAPAVKLPKLARLAEWVALGYAGEMTYLAESMEERSDPSITLPTVQSVISVGTVYNTRLPYSTHVTDPDRVAISRYAWGEDYHDVTRQRLRLLLSKLAAEAGPGFEALSCVDHEPVQERVFAEAAGLGWIGKNTCVIHPELGSWFFLGELFTNLALEPDTPLPDQCGTCTRCIDACPTQALVEPYSLDATRCISYLTIETRGAIDESLRPSVATHVYGCDICQDVCPWNRRAAVSDDPAWQPRAPFLFPKLAELCVMSDADWSAAMAGGPMRRAGLHRIRRTLAYAAGATAATPEHEGREPSQEIETLERHESASRPVVRDALAWARRPLPPTT